LILNLKKTQKLRDLKFSQLLNSQAF